MTAKITDGVISRLSIIALEQLKDKRLKEERWNANNIFFYGQKEYILSIYGHPEADGSFDSEKNIFHVMVQLYGTGGNYIFHNELFMATEKSLHDSISRAIQFIYLYDKGELNPNPVKTDITSYKNNQFKTDISYIKQLVEEENGCIRINTSGNSDDFLLSIEHCDKTRDMYVSYINGSTIYYQSVDEDDPDYDEIESHGIPINYDADLESAIKVVKGLLEYSKERKESEYIYESYYNFLKTSIQTIIEHSEDIYDISVMFNGKDCTYIFTSSDGREIKIFLAWSSEVQSAENATITIISKSERLFQRKMSKEAVTAALKKIRSLL